MLMLCVVVCGVGVFYGVFVWYFENFDDFKVEVVVVGYKMVVDEIGLVVGVREGIDLRDLIVKVFFVYVNYVLKNLGLFLLIICIGIFGFGNEVLWCEWCLVLDWFLWFVR